jgi:hypothetical protein
MDEARDEAGRDKVSELFAMLTSTCTFCMPTYGFSCVALLLPTTLNHQRAVRYSRHIEYVKRS